MDIFLSTGEISGDLIARDICRELRKEWYAINHKKGALFSDLHLGGLVGRHSEAEGVINILEQDDLFTVGYNAQTYSTWKEVLHILVGHLNLTKPDVFVGITHHMFNLPMAKKLSPQMYKILVSPPEIWGWNVNWKGKLLYHFRLMHLILGILFSISIIPRLNQILPKGLLRLKIQDLKLACDLLPYIIFRGKYSLAFFDKLVCLTPLNLKAYQIIGRERKDTICFVGHPAVRYTRGDLKESATAFREQNLIPNNAHMLNIFSGSRIGTVKLLLPEMLNVVVPILNNHPNLYCYVSVGDACLAKYIKEQIFEIRGKIKTGEPGRLAATAVDAKILLAASSHALLSSGTITLYASLLGIPGTIMYDLDKVITMLKFIVTRSRIGIKNKSLVPFGLPNALLLNKGWPKEKLPYEEFVLPKRRFDVNAIKKSIENRIRTFPEEYSFESAPMLNDETVNAVRKTVTSASGKPAEVLIANYLVGYLNSVHRNKEA